MTLTLIERFEIRAGTGVIQSIIKSSVKKQKTTGNLRSAGVYFHYRGDNQNKKGSLK